MPVSLQRALLAVATHVGPSTVSKCGSHGREQSDYFEGGEGVAAGSLLSHWVIALALTTEQPFPGCLWRRADAGADSAQLPSLGLLVINDTAMLRAGVPPSPPLLSHVAAQVRLVPAPA